MKRFISLTFIITSVIFLPACLKRKKVEIDKKVDIENKSEHIINNDDSLDDNFENIDTNTESYEEKIQNDTINKKSIFDDSNEEDNEQTIEYEEDDEIEPESFLKSESGQKVSFQDNSQKIMKLGTILFDFDVYNVIKKDQKENIINIIKSVNNFCKKNDNCKIIIKGHACNSAGSQKYNMQLSDKRAESVKKYIIKNSNLSNDMFETFGLGTAELIAYGNKEEQAPNRRAEIFLVK